MPLQDVNEAREELGRGLKVEARYYEAEAS